MNNLLICLIIIGLCSSALFFYVTSSIIFTIIYLIIATAITIYISIILYKKYLTKFKKFSECLIFMEKFIISLNSRNSYITAFESTYLYLSKKTIEIIDENKADLHQNIEKLLEYYKFSIFNIFKQVIFEHEVTGGNILYNSEFLIKEITRLKADQKYQKQVAFKTIISFGITWLFSFMIIGITKFSLKDFYSSMTDNMYFRLFVLLGFLIFQISVVLYSLRVFKLDYIKGGK